MSLPKRRASSASARGAHRAARGGANDRVRPASAGANDNGRTDGDGAARSSGPVPRTFLSAEQLEDFKQILLAKRRELVGDVGRMESEALGRNRADAAGDLSLMPIHMADIGTDVYEQEFTLGLIANEREMLKEIDEALLRIQNGTYGICLGTHQPINMARLQAEPWTRYCIEYKRQLEARGRR